METEERLTRLEDSIERRSSAHRNDLKEHISTCETDIVRLHGRVDILRTQSFSAIFSVMVMGLGLLGWIDIQLSDVYKTKSSAEKNILTNKLNIEYIVKTLDELVKRSHKNAK